MHLDLSDDESAALVRLFRRAIDDDRYPLSPPRPALRRILDKLDPPPVREPLPLLKCMRRRVRNRASGGGGGDCQMLAGVADKLWLLIDMAQGYRGLGKLPKPSACGRPQPIR